MGCIYIYTHVCSCHCWMCVCVSQPSTSERSLRTLDPEPLNEGPLCCQHQHFGAPWALQFRLHGCDRISADRCVMVRFVSDGSFFFRSPFRNRFIVRYGTSDVGVRHGLEFWIHLYWKLQWNNPSGNSGNLGLRLQHSFNVCIFFSWGFCQAVATCMIWKMGNV